MAEPEKDTVVEMGLEVARFYGALVSGGVPAMQAVNIAGEYAKTLLLPRISGQMPDRKEPWE